MSEIIVNLNKSLHVLPGGVMQPIYSAPLIAAEPSIHANPISMKGLEINEASTLELSKYLDYRHFLQDFYKLKRLQTQRDLRPYNYAVFSASANIKSPNYLKMIIEGKRNLSEDMIAIIDGPFYH